MGFSLGKTWKSSENNRDRNALLSSKLVSGLQNGIFWSISGIVLYRQAGNLVNWSLIQTGLVFVTIILSGWYGKIATIKRSRFAILTSSFLYGMAILFYIANTSLPTFSLFLLTQTIVNIIMSIHLDPITYKIMEEDSSYPQKASEYQVFLELATALGRISSLIVVFILYLFIQTEAVLILAIALTAVIPITTSNILLKTKLMEKEIIY